jgi:hypothetical protein
MVRKIEEERVGISRTEPVLSPISTEPNPRLERKVTRSKYPESEQELKEEELVDRNESSHRS